MNTNLLLRSATLFFFFVLAVSVTHSQSRQGLEKKDSTSASRSVESQLKALTEKVSKALAPEMVEAIQKGTEELIALEVIKNAKHIGDAMPSFTLPDARGKSVSSAELLSKGPLVVVFYRGAWCPFCNLYLHTLQDYLAEFRSYGASLVAISGENPDRSLTLEQKHGLQFTVLSDLRFAAARKFGIVYSMPKVINDAMIKRGFNLKEYYGTDQAELPLSATYVVDRQGKIVYAFLNPDFHRRADPLEIIQALSKLK